MTEEQLQQLMKYLEGEYTLVEFLSIDENDYLVSLS